MKDVNIRGIMTLGLKKRTINHLMHHSRIRNVGDLRGTTEDELLQIKYFGPKGVDDVNRALAKLGVKLGDSIDKVAAEKRPNVQPPAKVVEDSGSQHPLHQAAVAHQAAVQPTPVKKRKAHVIKTADGYQLNFVQEGKSIATFAISEMELLQISKDSMAHVLTSLIK